MRSKNVPDRLDYVRIEIPAQSPENLKTKARSAEEWTQRPCQLSADKSVQEKPKPEKHCFPFRLRTLVEEFRLSSRKEHNPEKAGNPEKENVEDLEELVMTGCDYEKQCDRRETRKSNAHDRRASK